MVRQLRPEKVTPRPRIRLAVSQSPRKRRRRIYAALRRARACYPTNPVLRKKLVRVLLANELKPKVRIGTDQPIVFARREPRR